MVSLTTKPTKQMQNCTTHVCYRTCNLNSTVAFQDISSDRIVSSALTITRSFCVPTFAAVVYSSTESPCRQGTEPFPVGVCLRNHSNWCKIAHSTGTNLDWTLAKLLNGSALRRRVVFQTLYGTKSTCVGAKQNGWVEITRRDHNPPFLFHRIRNHTSHVQYYTLLISKSCDEVSIKETKRQCQVFD